MSTLELVAKALHESEVLKSLLKLLVITAVAQILSL